MSYKCEGYHIAECRMSRWLKRDNCFVQFNYLLGIGDIKVKKYQFLSKYSEFWGKRFWDSFDVWKPDAKPARTIRNDELKF